jgi:hypothetical protein
MMLSIGLKKISLKPEYYIPMALEIPEKLLLYDSSCGGLESLIRNLLEQFNLKNDKCLESGVEYGYSTDAFSNYFRQLTGVDKFTGDVQTGLKINYYNVASKSLFLYSNLKLIQAGYRDFIKDNSEQYDFIHVNIVHDYKHTFECGLLSAKHSKCTIFHDITNYREVKRAVDEVAPQTGKRFYNYHKYYGLGIVV